nr:protein of unknown function (DUF3592) [uncultured bacterium]ALS92452.1 protein of unknown function (DUF3592) [uncultured bacterium]ALS92483.1 protein of unknown function (DUF3592) [uncultured bacterium]
MGILDKLLQKKIPTEAERKAFLRAKGRITEGVIIDSDSKNGDEIVYYLYTLNGVDFESSERLDEVQRCDRLKYAPGQKINVRFDPKNQGNSTLD